MEKTATKLASAQLPQVQEPRNTGMPLDLDLIRGLQANTSAIERRAATLPGRRSVKKAHQAAWLAKAVTMIDLTGGAGGDSAARARTGSSRESVVLKPATSNSRGSDHAVMS